MPEGGVWALVDEPARAAMIETPPFEAESVLRPSVLVGSPSDLGGLLEGRGQGDVRFEAVVGWNALTRCADRVAALSGLRALMRAGGELALAEVVPRESQRLSELADQEEPALAEALRRAEAAVYDASPDPRVGWRAQDPAAWAAEAGLSVEACEGVDTWGERRLSAADLDRWLAPDAPYARALTAQEPERAGQIMRSVHAALAGKTVRWRRRTCFLRARAG